MKEPWARSLWPGRGGEYELGTTEVKVNRDWAYIAAQSALVGIGL